MQCNMIDTCYDYSLNELTKLAFEFLNDEHSGNLGEDTLLLDNEELVKDFIGIKEKQNRDIGKGSCEVELKALPTSLRYEFLSPNNTFPVIVNSLLNEDETLKLFVELKKCKNDIGYSIDDLKGISLDIWMHREG